MRSPEDVKLNLIAKVIVKKLNEDDLSNLSVHGENSEFNPQHEGVSHHPITAKNKRPNCSLLPNPCNGTNGKEKKVERLLKKRKSDDKHFSNGHDPDSRVGKKRKTIIELQSSSAKNKKLPRKKDRSIAKPAGGDKKAYQSTEEAKFEWVKSVKLTDVQRQKVGGVADVVVSKNRDAATISAGVKSGLLLSEIPVVAVHPQIAQHLKPHHCDGIHFMWENLITSVHVANTEKGKGCVLSHCTSLGRTFQTVAFLHTTLLSKHLPKLTTALVICPSPAIDKWVAAFAKYNPGLSETRNESLWLTNLNLIEYPCEKVSQLSAWKSTGGVVIIGYSMFRSLLEDKQTVWKETLLSPDILVCDHSHLLVNSVIAQFVAKVKTKRKLILTNQSLQYNMTEFCYMVSLVKPRLLGNLTEFEKQFLKPIRNGQHVNSTVRDIDLMKKRVHALHGILAKCVQRKDYNTLKEHLLPKYEFTLKVKLSPLQTHLYEAYLSLAAQEKSESLKNRLIEDFNKLRLVICHPHCLVLRNKMYEKVITEHTEDQEMEDISTHESVAVFDDEDDYISLSMNREPTSLEDIYACSSTALGKFIRDKSGKLPIIKSRKNLVCMALKFIKQNFCKTRGFEESLRSTSVSKLKSLVTEHGGSWFGCTEKIDLVNVAKKLVVDKAVANENWFEKMIPSQDKLWFAKEQCGKIITMLEILQGAAKLGDKVVIFSQSLTTLDVIEQVLQRESDAESDASTTTPTPFRRWAKDKDYFRIDGSITKELWAPYVSQFNDPNNQRGRLLLVSTKNEFVCTNLVGANRAIIFDVSWNPKNDVQSIFRIHRAGQKKICYIYRLVAQGTMEEMVYERQVVKRFMSYSDVDEQEIAKQLSAADLCELYTFKSAESQQNLEPASSPPTDSLMTSILNSTTFISTFHETDTLIDHMLSDKLGKVEPLSVLDNNRTDAVMHERLPFKSLIGILPRNVMHNLSYQGSVILQSVDRKLSKISEKPLDVLVTKIKFANPAISTEQANLKAIAQTLDDHIQRRRLMNLRNLVLWHSTVIAQAALSSR